MTWYEIAFWIVQGLYDLFTLFFLGALIIGYKKNADDIQRIQGAILSVAKNVDDRILLINKNNNVIAQFLIKAFGLDEQIITDVPPTQTPPADLKN